MLLRFFFYLKGYFKVKITGHSPERFFNLIGQKWKCSLFSFSNHPNGYELLVYCITAYIGRERKWMYARTFNEKITDA